MDQADTAFAERARKSEQWNAWISDTERLLRLSRVLEGLVAPLRDAALSRVAGGEEAEADSSEIDAIRRRFEVRLLARERDFSLTRTGPAASVVAACDLPMVEYVALTAGDAARPVFLPEFIPTHIVVGQEPADEAGISVSIAMSKDNGVLLQVSGNDPDWVRGAFTALRDEVQRGVPRWSFLRAGQMWFAYTIVGALAFLTGGWPSLSGSLIVLGSVAIGGGVLVGTLLMLLARGILPGFELLSPGKAGKGARVLGILGAAALNIVGGVVAFFLTN